MLYEYFLIFDFNLERGGETKKRTGIGISVFESGISRLKEKSSQ